MTKEIDLELYRDQSGDHDDLIAAVETLRGQLIWGFYEEEAPEYTQGSEKLHGLHELVTADECNGLVKTTKTLMGRVAELEVNPLFLGDMRKAQRQLVEALRKTEAAEARVSELTKAVSVALKALEYYADTSSARDDLAAPEMLRSVLETQKEPEA